MKKSKRGFTLIELIIVVLIIAIFVGVGIPLFDRYAAKNDVVTKAEEIKILMETAQTMSANPEQGVTAYRVYRSGASSATDGEVTLGKTVNLLACDPSNGDFDELESINMDNFISDEFEEKDWLCLEASGVYKFNNGTVSDILPTKITVSSKKYNNMNLGSKPKIEITEQSAADIGNKLIFQISE